MGGRKLIAIPLFVQAKIAGGRIIKLQYVFPYERDTKEGCDRRCDFPAYHLVNCRHVAQSCGCSLLARPREGPPSRCARLQDCHLLSSASKTSRLPPLCGPACRRVVDCDSR